MTRQQLRRINFSIGHLALGGTEGQLVLLAAGLRERGLDVTVASLFQLGPREADLRAAGVPIFFPRYTKPGVNAPLATLRYIRWLRQTRPQIVHALLFHAYAVAPWPARRAGVPVVVAGRRSLGAFKADRRIALTVERWATRRTDLVVANSTAVARDTLRREPLSPEKVRVIYNGVPPEAFDEAAPAAIATDLPLIVSVANLKPYKGHAHLVRAAALLTELDLPVTLAFVGAGPEEGHVRRLAGELAVDVRLLGARRDIREVLARADVFAHPSDEEGFSNAVLEAMAAGKPIVATAVGGTPEMIKDTGVLVPKGDHVALALAISDLLNHPLHASSLGCAARERARGRFSVKAMVDAHISLYEELLAECAG